jgi:hypothetical protein
MFTVLQNHNIWFNLRVRRRALNLGLIINLADLPSVILALFCLAAQDGYVRSAIA